jgi:hypothetical protein
MIEELIAIANQPTISALTSIFASLAILSLIILFFLFLFFIAIYVYFALAWYMIAKKLKYKNAWLAWVPLANLFLLPILAKRKWGWGFFLFVPVINLIFAIIWCWKIYERRGYPGALSLFKAGYIIPPIFPLVFIIDIVITGIVAWEKKK